MLKEPVNQILTAAKAVGWVIEPEAKRLLAALGIAVPAFEWCRTSAAAIEAAETIGYPLVAKVVSARIMHKTDVGGVAVGVEGPEALGRVFDRFSRLEGFDGVLIDAMVTGQELIVGGKVDFQFGPVLLLGIGGTAVEIYQDTAIRMAPLQAEDVASMAAELQSGRLLSGHRGRKPVSMTHLTDLMLRISDLMTEAQDTIESLDLNPVFCSERECIVADARIVLRREG